MAIKGQNSCTLSTITDVKSIYTYHLLAPSTTVITNNMAPKDATTGNPGNPPGASSITITYLEHDYTWTISEPGINIQTNDIGTLYYIECTLFSNDTFDWGPIMTSSSYEAAKQAFNKATIVTNLVGDSPQHFWWLTTGHSTDIPAGAYITYVGQESFKNNPNNQPNLLLQSEGISLRNGITTKAQITSTGLEVLEGGIKGGQPNTNGYIYLSTIDYPLKDSTTTPPQAGLTINGHIPTASGTDGKIVDDPAWRAIVGTNFGVDSEGNLYASNATISGTITVGANSTIDAGATIDGTTALSDVVTNAAAGAQASEDLVDKADKIDSVYRTQQIYYRSIERIAEPSTIANNTWLSVSGTGYENWSLEIPSTSKEEYNLSTDVEIDTNKRYYTRSETIPYVYTLVDNPDSSLLNTYYELQIITYAYLYTAIQTQTIAQYDNGSGVECFCSVPVLDEATHDATKYITKIDNYGIKIHSFNDSNGEIDESNYVSIGTTGLQFFKGDISEPVATFGEFVQIGKSSNFHITLDVNDNNGELGFYQDDTKVAYINNKQLYITQSVVLEQMDLGMRYDGTTGFGQWSWKVHRNGQNPSKNNLNLKWVG